MRPVPLIVSFQQQRNRKHPYGPRPHRRTIDAARQRARPDQRQGAGVASAAVARRQGRHGFFPRPLEGVCRDGIFGAAGAGSVRRQRARLCRGRRGHGRDRPHLDAVAVSVDRGAGGVGAVARRQRCAEIAAFAENLRRLAARRARGRRGRQTSSAANRDAGGALRQRFQAQGRKGLCRRRPHRRSLDRRGAHRGCCGREQWPDAVPGRSQGQGHCGRAHRDGRCAQCGADRVRQCRSQRRQRARRGRSGRGAARRRLEYRPRRGRLRNGRAVRRKCSAAPSAISRNASSSAS